VEHSSGLLEVRWMLERWQGAEGINDKRWASDRGKPSDWFSRLSPLACPLSLSGNCAKTRQYGSD
jgi:hypothetical protein